MHKINTKQLNKYKNIFGTHKMQMLWNEFIDQAEDSWQKMDELDWESRRYVFHNWKSGGKIFGLDDFSQSCQEIEENILTHRFVKAEKQISLAKHIYKENISAVNKIFLQMESNDG